jgi:hypothetical protein
MVRSTVLNCTFVGHTVVLHIHSHRVQVMPRKPLVYDGLVSERRKLTKDQACKKVELMKTGTCKYRDLHYVLELASRSDPKRCTSTVCFTMLYVTRILHSSACCHVSRCLVYHALCARLVQHQYSSSYLTHYDT